MIPGHRPRRLHAPFDRPAAAAGATAAPAPVARSSEAAAALAAPAPVPTSLPPEADAVLDAEALARLRELDPTGANHLLQRVFQAYTTSAARLLPQMHEARRADDLAGVRHVVHTLKSSSASIGAIKLSQLCAEIETMIRLETLDDLPARLDQMDREMAIVLQALIQVPGVAP